MSTARAQDVAALARQRRRLLAAAAPWLHGEVARRMAERLAVVRKRPARVLDWWSRLGASRELLARAYPEAERVAVEAEALAAPAARTPWWSARRWLDRSVPAMLEAEVPPGTAALVWANMGLHHAADPLQVMRRWHRALEVDGFVMFSTLGPGTLAALRALYREQGWPSPHAAFVDMHDLGDMLLEAGFADPVMDQELLTLTWATPGALLAELRQLGGNTDAARTTGLRTPRWRARLEAALAARADPSGRIGLEFEIVYGHAFRPVTRTRVAARTELALEDLREQLQARRAPGPRGGTPEALR